MTEINYLDIDTQALIKKIKSNSSVYAIWLKTISTMSKSLAEGGCDYEQFQEDFYRVIHQCITMLS